MSFERSDDVALHDMPHGDADLRATAAAAFVSSAPRRHREAFDVLGRRIYL